MKTTQSEPGPAVEALLDAALEQFGTHGFAKTTMTDIARASGLSRTALYNHFAAKEDVFRAISSRLNAKVYEAVHRALRDGGDRDAQVLAMLHARVSWVYELLHVSQFGRELIDEKNKICGGQVLAANDQFSKLLTGIIEGYQSRVFDAATLASVLIQSVNGVLENAVSREAAQRDVETLVRVFCRGLQSR
jgi:AcrR family transcriptional regulator